MATLTLQILFKKNEYEKDWTDFENKVNKIDEKTPDVTNLVKKTDFNTKVTEIVGKIPDVSSLVTKSALTVVENKIPDISSLLKKTDYNTKVSRIENKVNNHNHDKCITTPEFNTMTADAFKTRLSAQTDLIRKPDFDLTFDSSYFLGETYFEGNDGAQNALVFQTMEKHFKLMNENQIDK